MMKVLAKSGFTQSYTYFTWRNTKQELTDYLTEITTPPVAEYFRGNLWPNTPDILHETLQQGGRPAFKTRLVLAATLSSVYGIYSGYELCENVPREPGSEEYLNSEKYEYKARDWDAPGNLVDYVTRINRIRRENRALHAYTNLRFYDAENPNIVFYGKMTPERDNVVFVAVNLDPLVDARRASVDVPIAELGIGAAQTLPRARAGQRAVVRVERSAELRGATPERRARADLRPSPLRRRAGGAAAGGGSFWGRVKIMAVDLLLVLAEVDQQPLLVEKELQLALLADARRRPPAVHHELAVEDVVLGLEPERAHDLLLVARRREQAEVDDHLHDPGGRLRSLVQPTAACRSLRLSAASPGSAHRSASGLPPAWSRRA